MNKEINELYQQSDAIRDYVFPLAEIKIGGDGLHVDLFLGSGFLINRDYAITARHVIHDVEGHIGGLFVNNESHWQARAVRRVEEHPTEDIAVIELEPASTERSHSFFHLSSEWVGASFPYHLWGYPGDIFYEQVANDGLALPRPDLVYAEGYVRRRISNIDLPAIRGSAFIELSQPAGLGFSGAPILRRVPGRMWHVVGVYLGERKNEDGSAVGYGVRFDSLTGWKVEQLGHTLFS